MKHISTLSTFYVIISCGLQYPRRWLLRKDISCCSTSCTVQLSISISFFSIQVSVSPNHTALMKANELGTRVGDPFPHNCSAIMRVFSSEFFGIPKYGKNVSAVKRNTGGNSIHNHNFYKHGRDGKKRYSIPASKSFRLVGGNGIWLALSFE